MIQRRRRPGRFQKLRRRLRRNGWPWQSRRSRRSERLPQYETQVGLRPAALSRRSPLRLVGWLTSHLTLLTGIIFFGCALYVMSGTTWFYIYDIEVEGSRLATRQELYARAGLEALHILWVNPSEIAARLREDPLIADAKVSASLPNRVRVTIVEREPAAVWQTGGESYFVDGEGALFALRGDASEMLVIRDLRDAPLDGTSQVDPQIVRAAQSLHTLIPSRRAFDYEPGQGLSFVTDGKWRVTFGDHTRLPAKVAAFEAFLEQIQSEKEVLLLDLSAPEHPYYRTAP